MNLVSPLIKRIASAMSLSSCFIGEIKGNSSCGEKLLRLTECHSDIRHHLEVNHLSSEPLTEVELILLRSGVGHLSQGQVDTMWICTKHRLALGKQWRPSRLSCHYPKHDGKRTGLKARDTIGVKMCQNIKRKQLYQVHVSVGSRKKIIYLSVSLKGALGTVYQLHVYHTFVPTREIVKFSTFLTFNV